MAKTKAKPITEVVITYDLFDLPSAQHKAGLAGLLLEMESARKRGIGKGCLPEVVEQTPTRARIRFTEKGLKALFDDLYAARKGRIESRSQWRGSEPIEIREIEEIDPETKEPRKTKRFVYEVEQPSGHFLRDHYPDEDGVWLKLWRDMLWAIPRGIPKSRLPFQKCLATGHCDVGKEVWDDLVKVEKKWKKNEFHTADVASSLWLGAQALNAEAVPFKGRSEHNLVLHFWPLAALIFVPQQITSEGDSEFVGYALAIPEVADLESFCNDYPQMLRELGKGVRGFRPADAVIDLPAEGALAFLEHLARLTERLATRGQLRYCVSSVEFLHLNKVGNNIKSLAAGRVPADRQLLMAYRKIIGDEKKPATYRNPLFRRGLLHALLNGRSWYLPMAPLLAERPWPFFIRSVDSPKTLPWFWQDVQTKFDELFIAYQETLEEYQTVSSSDPQAVRPENPLPLLIHRLVANYVSRRTEEKSRMKWEDFKDRKIKDEKTGRERIDIPEDYREAREKVASGTFLEMRSRREQEFVDHFTAVFCSVRQYLPEEDFRTVALALLDQPENVKTLTLLALSANS